MPRFTDYQPQLQVVNSSGTPIEGPYRFDVKSGAGNTNPPGLGITLGGTEPWYEDERNDFTNLLWQKFSYLYGYRYYVNLNFAVVEGAAGQQFYGLTLLDRLFQIQAATQVPYAALQFSLFVGSPFFGICSTGGGFHPQKADGQHQGLYALSLSFMSRDLQQTPRAWASSLW